MYLCVRRSGWAVLLTIVNKRSGMEDDSMIALVEMRKIIVRVYKMRKAVYPDTNE